MRNVLKLALLLVLLTGASNLAQAQKFGYLNSAAILTEMPEVKQAEANLEALQTQLQKRLQANYEQLQQDFQAVQQKVERGELSPRQQEEEGNRLREREAALAKEEQDMAQQLQTKRNELLQPIYERVNNAIKAVATEGSFTMIFDQQVLLYSDPAGDVSTLVKAKLAAGN
jgi:outer membrane protein